MRGRFRRLRFILKYDLFQKTKYELGTALVKRGREIIAFGSKKPKYALAWKVLDVCYAAFVFLVLIHLDHVLWYTWRIVLPDLAIFIPTWIIFTKVLRLTDKLYVNGRTKWALRHFRCMVEAGF